MTNQLKQHPKIRRKSSSELARSALYADLNPFGGTRSTEIWLLAAIAAEEEGNPTMREKYLKRARANTSRR